ncbi:DUF4421 family protein [Hugenholtzia roseola]|uniref:DUF4421 family protein n=1 Tax=Hugenholtzia roseola TaxID=1002 RepID=UPI000A31E571|nr:DUF4421 family protein [Hugenholtzia roseola]
MWQRYGFWLAFTMLFLGNASVLGAAPESENCENKTFLDSTYIQNFINQFSFRFVFSQKANVLYLSKWKGREPFVLDYRSNRNLNMGIGLSYKQFSTNLLIRTPFVNNDQDRRGISNFLDLQANFFSPRLNGDVFFQRDVGFYQHNITDYEPNWWENAEKYPLYPNMRVLAFGATLYQALASHKFSYQSAFVQNALQKRSAGSVLIGAHFYGMHAKNNDTENVIKDWEKSLFYQVGGQLGYGQTFVKRQKWFCTFAPALGLGLGWRDLDFEEQNLRARLKLMPSLHFKGALGYNSKTFYGGFNYQTSYFLSAFPILNSAKEEFLITQSPQRWRIFIGYRWNLPDKKKNPNKQARKKLQKES